MPRVLLYSPEVADAICDRLMDGESLRKICASDDMPSKATVLRWLHDDTGGFEAKYTRARAIQFEGEADRILELADICREGVKTTVKANGDVETVTADMIERAKLQIDTRKWFLSKLVPKKYGDKLQTELSGPGGQPIQTEARIDVSSLTPEQLRALAGIALPSE